MTVASHITDLGPQTTVSVRQPPMLAAAAVEGSSMAETLKKDGTRTSKSSACDKFDPTRRLAIQSGVAAIAAGFALPALSMLSTSALATPEDDSNKLISGDKIMGSYVKTKDGVEIYYKDWGQGQPIVFHHGWPLSADDWDNQMLFFLQHGYRVIAHDRRGHGRSTQAANGHDMDTYAADAAAVVEALDLRNAIHIGHSTGGGEVARYVARYGKGRVAKAVLVSGVPPLMLKTDNNPGGTPISVFDGLREQLAANRAQFFLDVASGPFYGFNRPGAKVSQGIIQNWWRQGMMGAANAHYLGIKAFSETDQSEDLKAIEVPTFVIQGDDDQIVPYKDAVLLQAKLIKNATLKVYPGYPHGMLSVHADVINPDLLAFIRAST